MTSETVVDQISVSELKQAIEEGKKPVLLDVREAHELEICKLEYTIHIPLGDLRFRLDELDVYKDADLVVYCRSGRRSNLAAEFLKELGFEKVKNMTGGVLAWSDQIDSSFRKY
ncbi:MAG: hypothetical protein K2X27_04685 [Candidatus Obscuribacterales bacterium]|nr:hypothetical protein [Candidatus Obscuribacterales bacterium]